MLLPIIACHHAPAFCGRRLPEHSGGPARLACSLAFALLSAGGSASAQVPVGSPAPWVQWNVPAQPLTQALGQLSRRYGISIGGENALLEGLQAPGLQGRLTLQQALERLLAGQGLDFVHSGKSSVTVVRASGREAALPAVTVKESMAQDEVFARQGEGDVQQGYRSRTASSVGALGSMDLLDAPFSMSVAPQALIQNIQAQSPDDVYRIMPSTLSQTPQASGWAPMVRIRGFSSYDRADNGLRRSFGFAASLEDKERVEVLSGLSGFLFGASAPGGMVNYVSKRPTQQRLSSVTLGNYGGAQNYVHGDFGGPVDSGGTVGYRVNLVRQSGETAVDDQRIDRTLASLGLDIKPSRRLRLELDASYSDYQMAAPTAYWSFREGVPRIKAPDSARNWGQPWTRDDIETRKWMARSVYEASDHLTLRAAYMREDLDRPLQDHTMNSVRSTTQYYQLRQKSGRTRMQSDAWQALADLSFSTGPVEHRVTLGYYGYASRAWSTTYAPHTGYQGPNGFDAPTHVTEPAWPAEPGNAIYYSGRTRNDNLMVGDMLRFNDQWSALLGLNRSTIKSDSQTPAYDRSRTSPSLSLVFKPESWLTTYVTYIEGLEQGGIAPLAAANRLEVMPPMQSRQRELGVKAQWGELLLSGALFDIEKAYEFTSGANVYSQDGVQRHRGAEISAFGRPTRDWSVVGGVTVLTAKVHGGASDGRSPMNVPRLVAKLYSEYALPFAPGLSLTGGIYHVGSQWATATNSSRLPAFTTLDLGLRYATRLSGRALTLRMNLNNAADRDYWLNSYYLGSPRSLAFSAQMQF